MFIRLATVDGHAEDRNKRLRHVRNFNRPKLSNWKNGRREEEERERKIYLNKSDLMFDIERFAKKEEMPGDKMMREVPLEILGKSSY